MVAGVAGDVRPVRHVLVGRRLTVATVEGGERFRLTVLGTTDLHGNVFNWDYYRAVEYDDAVHNDIGVAKVATLIKAIRAERGADHCLTIDAGDTIQGTPLAYYYARVEPIGGAVVHPMATAMNAIGYDAAALGNHEFDYGLDLLRTFEQQCEHPLLAANAVDWETGTPIFPPWVIKTVQVPGCSPVRVGILGLVTPGVAIWDKAHVEGTVRFPGIVEQATVFVPRLKEAGADVVIVSCHSGADTSSSYGTALPSPENASSLLAQEVPDIDAILVGHAHVEIPQRRVVNRITKKTVLLSEPACLGTRVSVMDLDLEKDDGRWQVTSSQATTLNSNTAPEDVEVAALIRPAHQKVLAYVNGVVGSSSRAMSAATSRYEDTAAMGFIGHVQARAVKAALAGSPDADTPVLSVVAPFNRAAAIPRGDVTVRDVAGLYLYDNTLVGITFTGAQVLAYLEFSAAYFRQVSGTGPFAPPDLTNAVTPTAPNGTPDYNDDIVSGLDAPLTYDIDIAEPVGSRITALAYAGSPVAADDRFTIAVNSYRQSGGGGFPGVTTAPVVYDAQVEIRQLIIEWVTAHGTVDPSTFSATSWRLVSGGVPITITP